MSRRRILGMRFPAVEPTNDRFPHKRRFGRVSGPRHSLGQRGQVFSAQLALRIQAVGKVNHFRLLLGRQLLDFLNNLRNRHKETLTQSDAKLKLKFGRRRPNLPSRDHDAEQITKCAVKSQASVAGASPDPAPPPTEGLLKRITRGLLPSAKQCCQRMCAEQVPNNPHSCSAHSATDFDNTRASSPSRTRIRWRTLVNPFRVCGIDIVQNPQVGNTNPGRRWSDSLSGKMFIVNPAPTV